MKKNVIVKTQKGEKEKEKSLNGKGKEEKSLCVPTNVWKRQKDKVRESREIKKKSV